MLAAGSVNSPVNSPVNSQQGEQMFSGHRIGVVLATLAAMLCNSALAQDAASSVEKCAKSFRQGRDLRPVH